VDRDCRQRLSAVGVGAVLECLAGTVTGDGLNLKSNDSKMSQQASGTVVPE
jgi:hypothetical protein